MADSQTPSLEELVSSAVQETFPADTEQPPSSQAEGEEKESVSSAREEAAESLTPNLRRIRDSLKDDEEFQKLPPTSQARELRRLAEADKAFHKDKASLADWKRKAEVYDALEKAGVTIDKIQGWIEKERKGETAPAAVAAEASKALRGLDRLLAQAKTPEEREAVRDIGEVLKEEMESLVESHPKTKALEQEVAQLRTSTMTKRVSTLDAEIDKLEERYPSSLIEKYRAQIKTTISRPENANVSARKMLNLFASDEELEEAETFMAKQPPKGESPKKPLGTSAATPPSVEEKELEPYKEKKGGWDLRGLVGHVFDKAVKF